MTIVVLDLYFVCVFYNKRDTKLRKSLKKLSLCSNVLKNPTWLFRAVSDIRDPRDPNNILKITATNQIFDNIKKKTKNIEEKHKLKEKEGSYKEYYLIYLALNP